jgi:uncharacterized protein (DUF1015 family)
MKVSPFAALRPAPGKAAAIAAVPYDVVDTAEARILAAGNPDSFLHVSRPDIDLPDDTDPCDPIVYETAAKAFAGLQGRGSLVREDQPRFYLYRQVMGAHSQTGLVACCAVDDYLGNVIRKHEKTRQDKEDDRTRHVLALRANSGPVFLTYRDSPAIDALAAQALEAAPVYDFTAPDGVRHTVWIVEGCPQPWIDAFAGIPAAYVADGHHRSAAAARAGKILREANPSHTGTEEYNGFMAVIFPASQLNILPYNRLVQDLNGLSTQDFLAKAGERFDIRREDAPGADAPGQADMYLAGEWYRLSWTPDAADPVGRLDVSVLQQRLLAPVLGIDDPRTDTRISFLGGVRGNAELAARVDSGEAAVAFAMVPVTVAQMMDIADVGQIMPPKSTWFEPKLRSGLLVHTLD